MAMATTLHIPTLMIETKRKTAMKRFLVQLVGATESKSKSESWILTPSNTKRTGVREYMVQDMIHDDVRDTWTYHCVPVTEPSRPWQWNQSTERIHISLLSLGMGHFWNEDDNPSWSIVVQWSRL